MILGNGLLGLAFLPHESSLPANVLVIARGVSDSLETCDAAYAREWQLLEEAVLKAEAKTRLVYFSTSRLDTPLTAADRRYFHHKRAVEEWLLSNYAERALIVRLPHIVGAGGHPNTVFNYLWRSVCAHEPFVVYAGGERRELLDVEEVAPAVLAHLEARRHGVQRVRGISLEVTEIVRAMQQHHEHLAGRESAAVSDIPVSLKILLRRYAITDPNTHRGTRFLSRR